MCLKKLKWTRERITMGSEAWIYLGQRELETYEV